MSSSLNFEPPSPVVEEYSRLLSFASHELRTPASVVGGYLRMLQLDDGSLGERRRKMIDEAAKSCARLVELLTELSEIGKLDNNTAAVHTETFDLFDSVEQVAASAEEGRDRDVVFRAIGQPAGARLTGDKRRLTAALAAIVRATLREQPSPVVIVADRRLVRSAGKVMALVVIAPEGEVDKVLSAAPGPYNERRGGTGLSLPIAHRAIQRAGGRLWAPACSSDDDRGLRSAAVVAVPVSD